MKLPSLMVKSLLGGLIDLFFPSFCVVCGARTNGEAICSVCVGDLPFDGKKCCSECGEELVAGVCSKHTIRTYPFFIAAFHFDDDVRALIHLLKYSGRSDVGKALGGIMAERLELDFPTGADAILPVPLHSVKKRDRGYNQSEIIAGKLSKKWAIPMLTRGVHRIRHTKSQTRLNATERAKNVAGAFVASNDLAGKSIIIVDDVITTGATSRGIAAAIKAVGGDVHSAVCVARPGIEDSRKHDI